MVSNCCTDCVVNWMPYQTPDGRCPVCGGGTVRRQQPASSDALDRYTGAMGERRRLELHAQFETYYAEREARRRAEPNDEQQAA